MFFKIYSQKVFLSISVSILFEIASALWNYSLFKVTSVFLEAMSKEAYFSSCERYYSKNLASLPRTLAFSTWKILTKES
jgi:hypothetical protein